MPRSRRSFLKLSALGLAANSAGMVPAFSRDTPPSSPRISVWVTSDTLRFSSATPIAWAAGQPNPAGAVISLHPESKFQEILGFGAALTDAACYTLNTLPPAARESAMQELFAPSEMNLSVCRTCVGSSDYATKVYSYDDGEADPALTRFSIEHDRAYILPILRQARKINPDLFLFSSPWSPPGWMKSNGSMLGGNMQRKYMPSYANYFLKFLRAYEAEGAPVQAVTVQNEVDTDQDGRMPACTWPQEYEADFVRQHLGPLFQREGIKTRIWIIDHNYNLWGRAIGELETPDVRKYTNSIAWHGYLGEPEWIDRVHDRFPDVEMYWTEGGPDYTDPHYLNDWCSWSATFAGILRHWCRSITAWNFALDEKGHPNIGPFTCGGLVTIHSQTKEITKSGQFHAFAHYSRTIRRGARRIDSQSSDGKLQHVAVENPDGSRVLVVTNSGPTQNVVLQLGTLSADAHLDANSITTFAWR